MKIVGAEKLLSNYRNPETSHKVAYFVAFYYGNEDKLEKSIDGRRYFLEKKLERFRTFCERRGVEPIDINWLKENLEDGGDSKKFYAAIDQRKKDFARAESLRDLFPKVEVEKIEEIVEEAQETGQLTLF